jgi:hypothetical protein
VSRAYSRGAMIPGCCPGAVPADSEPGWPVHHQHAHARTTQHAGDGTPGAVPRSRSNAVLGSSRFQVQHDDMGIGAREIPDGVRLVRAGRDTAKRRADKRLQQTLAGRSGAVWSRSSSDIYVGDRLHSVIPVAFGSSGQLVPSRPYPVVAALLRTTTDCVSCADICVGAPCPNRHFCRLAILNSEFFCTIPGWLRD